MSKKSQKQKPGPKPEVFKVDVPFEDAVKIALNTKAPGRRPRPKLQKDARGKQDA
jgi:hypothetical protein